MEGKEGVDKYRSPPPPGNEKGTENLGQTKERSASLLPQSTRTDLDLISEWTCPRRDAGALPPGEAGCSLLHISGR